jgi:hypothetical protein
MKRILIGVVTLLLLTLPLTPSMAESHGFTCTVTGTAAFTPGLTADTQEMKFSFKGELTDCQATGEATDGTVTAKGTANGSCASGKAEGVAKVKWSDGKKSTVEFSTTDVAAGVLLQGSVTKSNAGGAVTGDDVLGVLAFNADPQQCETKDGVQEADFQGQVVGGSPS